MAPRSKAASLTSGNVDGRPGKVFELSMLIVKQASNYVQSWGLVMPSYGMQMHSCWAEGASLHVRSLFVSLRHFDSCVRAMLVLICFV